jgi:hypothetical protein
MVHHRLITVVMLVMLILQGVTLAAADVAPPNVAQEATQSMVHCAGHEAGGTDCACCSGSEMSGVNCAAQCSVAVSISPTLPTLIVSPQTEVSAVEDLWIAGPSYSPLNPPPIA